MTNRVFQSLSLLSLKGVGPKTARQILELTSAELDPSSQQWINHLLGLVGKAKRFRPSASQLELGVDDAKAILERSDKSNIEILSEKDPRFPKSLNRLPDPPLLLHCKGNLSALEMPSIAIVGTRHPLAQSRVFAHEFAQICCRRGKSVLSGMALGCDAEGHKGALSVNGVSIAVMAHGLDSVFPRENEGLTQELLQKNGLLVSEYPIGAKPTKSSFVQRDRITAGLANAVVAVEAGRKSGTMHTMECALSLNTAVGCLWLKGVFENHVGASGNAHLIQDRAASAIDGAASFECFLEKTPHHSPLQGFASTSCPGGDQLSLEL